jgi:uncharacterized protein YkwD
MKNILARVRHAGLFGLLLAGLVSCGGGDEEASSSLIYNAAGGVILNSASSCGLPAFRTDLLIQINAARAQARFCGAEAMPAVGSLEWDERLFSAAAKHATDMAQNNYFDHMGLDGGIPSQRISAEGYRWSFAGENIAAGQTSVASVMAGWLASPGHCANLMYRPYTDVGVACVLAPSGASYSRYWVMKLGRP